MSRNQITDNSRQLQWRKSSYSGSDGGDCVEVATAPGVIHVRDSKHAPGPILRFPAGEWVAFLSYAGQHPGADG